ncbi:MAG: ABC transporter permease [Candidatus Saccharibacteria bacterium]|nr:ABC transporter permease [Candidatus Saccharibacteria bacterium]
MSLSLKTHFNLARTALKRRKGRTFLTCLGIAIGVGSIIVILSLMSSVTNLIADQLKAAGENLVLVRPSTTETQLDSILSELTSTNKYSKSSLTSGDVDFLRNLDPDITAVSPLAINSNTLTSSERTVDSATVVGTSKELQSILNLHLASGNFLNDISVRSAVVGHDLALLLFGSTEPIGKTFTLLGETFIVTGVLDEINDPVNFNNVDFDSAMLIDITNLMALDGNIQIQQINVQVTSTDILESISETIRVSLKDFKSGDTNFSVAYGEDITHPAGSLLTIVTGILTTVASISLVVGGIGVMNIMLVAVSERTHEVGIRKAIGATNLNIFLQFFFESLILCFIGGVAGIILGYILSFLISVITPFNPYFSFEICGLALATSIIVGTLFGLYPAIKAAHKDPIDSLKNYS